MSKEVSLYKEILFISKKENELLSQNVSLKEVFQTLPQKMLLIEKINQLDQSIRDLKEELIEKRTLGEPVPLEIKQMLQEGEKIIHETILMDEQNQKLMSIAHSKMMVQTAQSQESIENKTLRAKRAYEKK